MAREVIIRTWCDQHLAEGERVEAAELPPLTLQAVGTKPRVVALCEPCRKELYDPLVQLLKDHGQMVDEPRLIKKSTPARASEPVPTTSHDGEREPRTVTQAGGRVRAAWRSPGDATCPVPGCDWDNGTRSALGQHALTVHGEMLPVLEGRHGYVRPDGAVVQLDHRCPHCDAAYRAQASLSNHLDKTHG